MRWLVLAAAPAAFHDALSGVEGELVLFASVLVSLGVIWTKFVRPCAKAIAAALRELREAGHTVQTVPGRLDAIECRLDQGAVRMDDLDAKLQVMADSERQEIRTIFTAAAARHSQVLTEDQARVHWRD